MNNQNSIDLSEGQKFADELISCGSRGCAVLAASWLESALSDLIRAGLVKQIKSKIRKDLFEGFGLYASFSACITVCFINGYISKNEYKALDYIKKIRNKFAHANDLGLSFDDEEISKHCENLFKILPVYCPSGSETNQMRFCQCAGGLVISISHMRIVNVKPAVEAANFE